LVATTWCGRPPRRGGPPAPGGCPVSEVLPGQPLPPHLGDPRGGPSPYPWPIPMIAANTATKPELRNHFDPLFPDFELDFPDQLRADEFLNEFQGFVQARRTGAGALMPELVFLRLPNDHTGGTRPGHASPEAQVADNDLALGRIIEAISRSRFWPETCIFVIEDDPQDGWDHVSGFRTTAYVASPYTRRGVTVSTQYNQTSLLRTMELILGLPPMNQLDATATPMFDCFTDTPDLAPFVAVPNNIPLDQMNPAPKKLSDPLLRKEAYASARLRLDQPDRCPEDVLNHILWHAMKGPQAPYPEWAVRSSTDDD